MAKNRDYQPLSATEEGEVKEKEINWNENTEIIPTHTRSFVICMSVFLLSLSANVLLVLDNSRLRNSVNGCGKSKYSK